GSLFNNWPEFYQMLFPVVRDMEINVLCALGKALRPEDLGEIPDNVELIPFAPQLDVLRNADYFITHAGTGSAMEAMYYGVPCVCIPQMDEQQLTARQMVRLGVASTSMVRAETTEESLRDALTRLMTEPHYRENAQKLSRIMRETGGSACAAKAIIEFMENR
ncbi:MAG: nucleotide disphospho-sugar-binding domain-containing protein, partial [Aristaeellaceae bacterium]